MGLRSLPGSAAHPVAGAGAVRQLASLGRVAPDHLTFRADFPAAAIEGKAAAEFSGTKAAEEAAALWAFAQALVDGLTP